MCSLVAELVASQAVKMCITPSAPQGPCIFMGLPLTSMRRLSCGLSEQTIQLGGGDWKSLWCVSAACDVCLCVCLCECLRMHEWMYIMRLCVNTMCVCESACM